MLAALSASAAETNGELATIKERELETVRARISALKQSMDESAAARDRLTRDLQAAEVEIAAKRIRLEGLEREREFSARRKAELDARLADRQAALYKESTELANQVRAAYMSGNQERIKLLLNQGDPATLGRLMAYYGYLNDYRAGNIEKVTAAIRQLAAQEKDLSRLIAELTTILSDYPITSEDPFTAHSGRLTWPVVGTLLHDFGQPRAGGRLKWNGVVLAAPRGREVRSVYHGRVEFADWLAGMGLLIIVNHGEGYLTLYGYNETLLKNVGDWVAPGDVIASVGDSGGQSQAGLYFEIRKGTTPVNPRDWVTRRPGG